MCARKLIRSSSPHKCFFSVLRFTQLVSTFKTKIFLIYDMYVYTLLEFSMICLQSTKDKVHNHSWTSWVGGYYIAFTKTTYYLPPPFLQLALKWPAHGRIIRRIQYMIPYNTGPSPNLKCSIKILSNKALWKVFVLTRMLFSTLGCQMPMCTKCCIKIVRNQVPTKYWCQ